MRLHGGSGKKGRRDRVIQPRTPLRGFINCHRRVICSRARAKGTWSIARSTTYLIAAFIRTIMSRSFNEAAARDWRLAWWNDRISTLSQPSLSLSSSLSSSFSFFKCTSRLYKKKNHIASSVSPFFIYFLNTPLISYISFS